MGPLNQKRLADLACCRWWYPNAYLGRGSTAKPHAVSLVWPRGAGKLSDEAQKRALAVQTQPGGAQARPHRSNGTPFFTQTWADRFGRRRWRCPPFFGPARLPGPLPGGIIRREAGGAGGRRGTLALRKASIGWNWAVQRDHSQREDAERDNTSRDQRLRAGAGGLRQPADRNDDRNGAPRNDAHLIDEALAGQSASFGELVTKYQDRLYNSVLHVIGSADEAYDVVQDAFVQAFLKLDSFSRQAAFYTWLYRIAFNLAVSRRRRQRPAASVERTKELTGEEPLGRDDAPGARLQQQERAAMVHSALAALAEEYRAVIVLREIDGCDYETIGEILDLPVGTVRSRLHRARAQLREQLKAVLLE